MNEYSILNFKWKSIIMLTLVIGTLLCIIAILLSKYIVWWSGLIVGLPGIIMLISISGAWVLKIIINNKEGYHKSDSFEK